MGSLDRDARGDRRRNFREATTVVARVTSGRAPCDNNMRAMDELKALFGVPLIGGPAPNAQQHQIRCCTPTRFPGTVKSVEGLMDRNDASPLPDLQ
jgi:hypothetical protein